jgi:hypothetical protein
MLVNGRPEMVRRAVKSFKAQTYVPALLAEIDGLPRMTIGEMRNKANAMCVSDIIVHWDSDDWSHPNRIAEQVALLQSSGADCVGYREMLFWRTPAGEAWRYANPEQNFCLGTSLCYWRHVWERKPFEALPAAPGGTGEDWKWQQGLKRTAVSAMAYKPRMIASIHGGNTSDYSILDNPKQRSFRRIPHWDEHCRKVMEG